jgi:acetyl-CoA carboxylase carboxyl transferase subunit alpha
MSNAYEVVQLARCLSKPTGREIINHLLTDFVELHGDRKFGDDAAVVGGIGLLGKMPITVIATQKGRNLAENLACNFGQLHPEGYRKALRLMKQAEKFKRPGLTLINTPGACPAREAEERGQGEAIAQNLLEMSALKVPVIAVIAGEGGSGGALGLAVADRVFMFEYSMYSILSPEGFAAILWKDANKAKEAACVMKLKPTDLLELGVIEGIIPETSGGSLIYLKELLIKEFGELAAMSAEELLTARHQRFRKF